MKNHSSFPVQPQRGSLLIVAMILCSVIGISIVSYMNLSRTTMVTSNRALYSNAAMNIAENGLEEAMFAINKMALDATYAWPGWTNDGTASNSSAWRKWTSYTFDQNTTGVVRVYVYNYTGVVAPRVVSRATITLGGATTRTLEKWVEVDLRKASKFANGLVAKNTITFNGNNATVDSWNSDPDNDNDPSDAVDYDATTKRDNGSVGSISVAVGVVGVNNADIFGYAATGGSAVTVGPQGKVGPFGTADGTIAPGHTSTDFSASFDPVSPPVATYTAIAAITGNTTLPGTAPMSADGTYYITTTKIDFNNAALNITPGKKVVLQLTNTGSGASSAISVGGGSGAINIGVAGKLEIYTAGDISIAGSGVLNGGSTDATANQPINFQIWGTKTSGTQNISVSGNGVFSGIIYAPQGSVTMNGGGNSGNVSGSIVANDITLNGSVKFHYDESLGNMGLGNPFRVTAWKELTTKPQRDAYSSVLSF